MSQPLIITLSTGSSSILKVGFMIRALLILFFTAGVALFGIHILSDAMIVAIICFIIALILFRIFIKILSAAFFKEEVQVTKEKITVIHKTLTNNKEQVFNLDQIKYFGFADQQYTKHPMDNPVVDITGLATRERELQYVIDEGNISLVTDAKSIKFGRNMPSWDVEELVEKIETYTGRKFVNPKPVKPSNDIYEGLEADAETETEPEMEAAPEREDVKKHVYTGDYGELTIEQKGETPASEDMAYLNGKLAPTGKYQVGDKQFVMVSNGLIYAVRGFGDR